MVYPETGTHLVHVHDAIEGTTIGADFLATLREPFISCEWAK
jgi:hypothetical protein